MAIRYESIKTDRVPLPPEAAPKAKETKAPRKTFADKLAELEPGESFFLEGKKLGSIRQQVSAAKKDKSLTGTYRVVEFGIGGDPVNKDIAGIRVYRLEDKVVPMQQAAE